MNWTAEERSDATEIFVTFSNEDMQMPGDEIALLFFLQKVHWSLERTRSILGPGLRRFDQDLENLLAQVEREPESPREAPPQGGALAAAGLHPWHITPLSVMKRNNWERKDILKFRGVFTACDTENSGCISHHQLMAALSMMRLYPERQDVAILVAEVDVDGNGALDFWEFTTLIALQMMPETEVLQQKRASRRVSVLAPVETEREGVDYMRNEAEMRQLMVALAGFRVDMESVDAVEEEVNVENAASPKSTAAESLLKCIKKVCNSNMKTRIQLHLQNFVLDFLLMVPQIEAEPVKMANVNAHERWKWWCQYHCWDRRRPQFEDRHPRTPAGTTPERIAAQRPASSGAMTRVTTAPALPTGFSDSEEDRSGKMGDQSDGETQARYDVHQKMLARAKYRAGKIHNILPFLSQKPQSSETERDATISWKGALACEKQREAENRRKTSQLLFAPSGGSPCNLGFRGFKSRRRPSTATCEKAAKPTPKHIFPWFANDPKFHQRWTAHNALDPKTAQRFPLSSSKHHKPTHGSFKSTPSRRASSVGHPRQSSASNQLRTKIDIEENAYAMGSKTAAPHFKRAKELHIVPSYAPTHPEYAYYQMRDADLDAACHIAVSSDTIDVSYNRITRLEPLLQIPWIGECRILKLVGLKLAGESPFTQMSVKCPKLHTLSLAQTPLPQHWIHELTMALKRGWHRSLSYFNVAGTGLGRNGQHDCVKLFETLRLCNSLLELDISDNVLKEAGFRVIKDLIDEESRLRNLFMSDNGGSVGVDTGMNIVFEGISTNLSLQVLDISNSNLRFSDVFVLETMMMSHQGILDNILMASNPLGVRGMMCVLRMTTEGHVSMVDVANFRDCEYQDISFRAENPSGNYDLDMALVLDRVQLIRLLLWSDKWNMPHEGLFRDLKYEGKACELSHLCGRGKYNGYDVHVQTGRVRFIFTGHIPLRGKTNTDMLRNWHESRRHKMSMASFAVLANLYLGLRTEQEMDVLLRAVSSALLLKISHLRFLIEQSPIFMRAHVVITVYPALDFMDRLTGVMSCPV
eukprot:GEMP01002338.1.p1 GENE.GEMP01002338.1~~GEMP01002338.1.p1  ORF type:complete len:1038 (+),score=205.01 GEMP01002338.1:96-3209(+)